MTDAIFPPIPRAFYRFLLASISFHALAIGGFGLFRPAGILIPPLPPPTQVIWVKPGAQPLGEAASSRLLPPPPVAPLPAAATPAPSELSKVEKKAAEKAAVKTAAEEKAERKRMEKALAAVRELERRQRLAAAVQQMQQALGKRGDRPADNSAPGAGKLKTPGSPTGTAGAAGEGGEEIGLADYNYRQSVRQLYTNEMNGVYKARFAGRNLSAKARVRVDAAGAVVEGKLEQPSGDAFFDSAVDNILRRLKNLPAPPPETAAFYLDKGFLIDFNPQ
jgi:outer membrane biosynthesis protein TonB